MIRLGKESKYSPAQVIERSIAFFGQGGEGLDVTDTNEGSVRFEGGGGYVVVSVKPGEKRSDVDIVAAEWEYQAERFLGKI